MVLTCFGRTMKITQTIAKRLPETPPVVELDVQQRRGPRRAGRPGARARRRARRRRCTRSASRPRRRWAATSSRPSGRTSRRRCSLGVLAEGPGVAALPLMADGGSIVGLTFDARCAWPMYDWMGVAKAAFESTARYLARDLGPKGIRVNLVAAGPLRTTAAKSIPGFDEFEDVWDDPGAAGLGRARPRAGREGLRRAAVRLVPGARRGRSCTSTAACTPWAPDGRVDQAPDPDGAEPATRPSTGPRRAAGARRRRTSTSPGPRSS